MNHLALLLLQCCYNFVIQALESGDLVYGGMVTEGSFGSTAISLATVATAYGCRCHIVIPDDAAIEKVYSAYSFHDFFCLLQHSLL
jgi:cysteine synthase